MLKLVKSNPRKPPQAKAYKEMCEAHLKRCERLLAEAQQNIEYWRSEMESPKERDHYCLDCGSGFDTSLGAHYCCKNHP